ncbi:MAG: hypothetical protein ACYSUF_10050 [Planctomycetota bacterium]|jgi:hypothetical protein
MFDIEKTRATVKIAPVLPLAGPDAHGHRRDEHEQDPRQLPVELVEVGQVRVEKRVGPEGGERAQQHQGADEDVPDRAAEIAHKVALEDGGGGGDVHGILVRRRRSSAR